MSADPSMPPHPAGRPDPHAAGTYTVRRGDQDFGPYTAAELSAYVAAGNVVAADTVYDHGAGVWRRAGEVTGLQVGAAVPSAGVTPASPPTIPGSVAPTSSAHGFAVASVVLGAISIVGCGLVTGILAIVFGCRDFPDPADAKLGRIGMTLGIIGSALSILSLCVWLALVPFA